MDSLIIKDNTVIACSETDILSLKIPEGVTAISDNAFFNFKRLSEIQLPSSLKKIGDRAFEGCESLKKPDKFSKKIEKENKFDQKKTSCNII